MSSSPQKRKAKRVDCNVPVEGKQGALFDDSKTVNISEGGVGIITKTAVPIDTTMAVEISLSPKSEPIIALGQVKWVSQIPDSDSYRVGLSFSDAVNTSKSRLSKYFRK